MAESPQGWRQRAQARFETSLRVEYEYANQRVLAFSRDLSTGGMLLRNADNLNVGDEVEFKITLTGPGQPLRVYGQVLQKTRRGVHVQFLPRQTQVETRLRTYVRETVLPSLQETLKQQKATTRHVCELATLLMQYNSSGEALQLIRDWAPTGMGDRLFCETMAALWLAELTGNPRPEQRRRLMQELAHLCDKAAGFLQLPAMIAAQMVIRPQQPAAPTAPETAQPQEPSREDASREDPSREDPEQTKAQLARSEQRIQSLTTELREMQRRMSELKSRCNQLEASLARATQPMPPPSQDNEFDETTDVNEIPPGS